MTYDARDAATFSFELFPPRDAAAEAALVSGALPALVAAGPEFISVTYGASGSTRGVSLDVLRRLLETSVKPMAHLTCWIALDDATAANGCLQYVPASHRWNLLPITGLAGTMDGIRGVLSEDQRARFTPVAAEVPKGHASFHHPLTVHGSSANLSDRPRRGVVINVVRDGVRSASSEPLLQEIPPIGVGEPLGGRFFPLLFEPGAAAAASA